VVEKVAATCAVFLHNTGPALMERLCLGTLRTSAPRAIDITYVSISGFGE